MLLKRLIHSNTVGCSVASKRQKLYSRTKWTFGQQFGCKVLFPVFYIWKNCVINWNEEAKNLHLKAYFKNECSVKKKVSAKFICLLHIQKDWRQDWDYQHTYKYMYSRKMYSFHSHQHPQNLSPDQLRCFFRAWGRIQHIFEDSLLTIHRKTLYQLLHLHTPR